uniref:AbiTii domain-containing protein n=1 Tax=Roseihalotalea indica TaxID=2867963 RepID=A0AA49GJI8_9BACT|nr:hypothetical protein K4G66_22760 [Tunicatimonas sp. TK19036]
MDIFEKEKRRFDLLKILYELSNGDADVGFSNELVPDGYDSEFTYLKNEGLTKWISRDRIVITHRGVIEYESALKNPNQSTEHFSYKTINIVNIQNAIGSTIQQGGDHANQNVVKESVDKLAIENILSELKNIKADQDTQSEEFANLESSIVSIEAQLNISKPNKMLVNAALSVAKDVLVGINVSLYTPLIQQIVMNM